MPSKLELKSNKLTKLERDWFKWYTGIAKFNASKALEYARPHKQYAPDSIRALGSQIKKAVFAKLNISMDDLYEMNGLDDANLVRIGVEGLNATRPINTPDGMKAVPDYSVRHKYWTDFMKAKNLIKNEDKVNLNLDATVNIRLVEDRTLKDIVEGEIIDESGKDNRPANPELSSSEDNI